MTYEQTDILCASIASPNSLSFSRQIAVSFPVSELRVSMLISPDKVTDAKDDENIALGLVSDMWSGKAICATSAIVREYTPESVIKYRNPVMFNSRYTFELRDSANAVATMTGQDVLVFLKLTFVADK